MANIFSHPAFIPSGNYVVTGYNLYKSVATSAGAPNYFGPWNLVSGYSNYQVNTDIFDPAGTYWDLYRVQPILTVNGNTGVTLPMSRAFKASDSLYDMQISALLDHFRSNLADDRPILQVETTDPTEGTGASIMPFVTNAGTDRFYLSFMPNANPVRIVAEDAIVWAGSSRSAAVPLQPYTDFYADDSGGFIQFSSAPSTSSYLKVQYPMVRYTNDDCRRLLINAVSSLSLYGINGFEVRKSNNLYYLTVPLPNRDVGEIVALIAAKALMQSKIQSSFESAEQWDDGKIKYVSDPSRAIQAATLFVTDVDEALRHRCNGYIISSRSATHSQGEFDSFFDTSGILPVYSLIVSNYNAFGWWM